MHKDLLDFLYHEGMLCFFIRIAPIEAILMSTHNIPFSI